MSAKASGSDTQPNGSAKHREHHDGSAGRAYTVEQKAAVIRIKRCSPTAFYEILGLEEVCTSCSDGEIKKAYRKLSLLTHPDKNGYQGADEAFKLVSRAFQVLSDPDKKAKFDKFGGDPDSRFASAASGASSPFSNFARASSGGARAGPMFEEEISPEEMFRQFFGGGMGGAFGGGPFGGGMFDTGPGFVFNLGGGGPGIRVQQFGGGVPRRRPAARNADGTPAAQPTPSLGSAISSLLPLLILFILPILSSLFSGDSTPSGPSMRFDAAKPPHTQMQTSSRLGISYWVIPSEVEDLSKRRWRALDENAEVRYIHQLNVECEREQNHRERMIQDAQGWFFHDEDKMQEAREYKMKSCERRKQVLGRVA